MSFSFPISKNGWLDNSKLNRLSTLKIQHFSGTETLKSWSFVFSVKTVWSPYRNLRYKPWATMKTLNFMQSNQVINLPAERFPDVVSIRFCGASTELSHLSFSRLLTSSRPPPPSFGKNKTASRVFSTFSNKDLSGLILRGKDGIPKCPSIVSFQKANAMLWDSASN